MEYSLTFKTLKQAIDSRNFKHEGHILTFSNLKFEDKNIINHRLHAEYGINFVDCRFEEDLIAEGTVDRSISFRNCKFHSVHIRVSNDTVGIGFDGCEFDRLSICDTKFQRLGIVQSKGHCALLRYEIDNISIGDWISPNRNYFDSLHIDVTRTQNINFTLIHTDIAKLTLNGVHTNTQRIVFDYLKIKHFFIGYFYSSGNFFLTRIHTLNLPNIKFDQMTFDLTKAEVSKINQYYNSSLLVIFKTDLSKVTFNGFDLNGFVTVNISETNISDAVFNNTKWPRQIYSFSLVLERDLINGLLRLDELNAWLPWQISKETREDHSNIRNVYRQLKLASSKQGDIVSEQFFHGKEMNAYYKSINWGTNLWTKAVLILSKVTSNFGQSFILPLLFLLLSSAICAFLVWVAMGSPKDELYMNSGYWVSEILRYANPLRKISEYHTHQCNYIYAIDTLSIVPSSYLIYNIIRATRRFVR